jgi:hypothetical protein
MEKVVNKKSLNLILSKIHTAYQLHNEYKHIFICMSNSKFTMRLKAGEEVDIEKFRIA